MSETDALTEGLSAFAKVLQEIKGASIEMMRIHPSVALLMTNLLGNIGYALFAVPNVNGKFAIGQWTPIVGVHSAPTFETRQELMAFIFRQTASHSGKLLDAKVVADLSQVFNIGKLLAVLAK